VVPEGLDGPLLLVNPPEEFDPATLGGVVNTDQPDVTRVTNRPGGDVLLLRPGDPNMAEWPVMIDVLLSEAGETGELRDISCNPHSAHEGEAFPTAESELRAPADFGRPASEIVADPPGPPPWTYLTALAVALALGQWCFFQRRWLS